MMPLTIELADEAATAEFAEDIAARLTPGDLIALRGGLGVGKTTFARALIRALADDPRLEVPSPTFTLAQHYADGSIPVTHFDLYRLAAPDELDELGFDEALGDGVALVEWPERADLPEDRLDLDIAIAGDGRRVTVTGAGSWADRLERTRAIRRFIDGAGWRGARRRYLQADASTRAYERIVDRAGHRGVLMDWPPRGESSGDRRSAYRARDVGAFAAVDQALKAIGLSAPEIYAADLAGGLLLLEDLGTDTVAPDGVPDPDRYACAVDVLAAIHGEQRPSTLPGIAANPHRLPALDAEALSAELTLFTDWYGPHVTGAPLPTAALAAFEAVWAELFARLAGFETSWVLFDIQAPNLPWLADRAGLARLGLLDFQDMFIGPAAFDVASLCQDMRVTIPADLERMLRDRYVDLRRHKDPDFDEAGFLEAYAIVAAERTSKNLGVFARLADRDGRGHYLEHVPRLREYLARALAHPALAGYAHWWRLYLPPAD